MLNRCSLVAEHRITETIAPSNRRLYRHESGMGTVICFNDGVYREVLVLDAKYRANRRFGARSASVNLEPFLYNPGGKSSVHLNPENIDGDISTTEALTVIDDWINANVVHDDKTARENCDEWIKLKDYDNGEFAYGGGNGVPAVAYCRSLVVPGAGACDLPNIQTLARIYCDADYLDRMDPTVASYSSYALGKRNSGWNIGIAGSGSGGNTYAAYTRSVFSSTLYNENNVWRVYLSGLVDGLGNRAYELPIVPVCELV